MIHSELIREFATKGDLTLKDARELIDVLEDIVIKHMRDEGGVKLFNGLTLSSRFVDEHPGHNPSNGEPITIAAKYQPVAKFGKSFKDGINA